MSNVKLAKLPCLRYKITDVRLFTVGHSWAGFERTRRWKTIALNDITLWASDEIKKIKVTQGFTSKTLTLEVRKFVPLEGDMIHKTWTVGGVEKKVLFPTYAIVSLQAALESCSRWINDEGPRYFNALLNSDPSYALLRETYSMAIWTSNHTPVGLECG